MAAEGDKCPLVAGVGISPMFDMTKGLEYMKTSAFGAYDYFLGVGSKNAMNETV
eukprot:CAMPEP_0202960124 /NCGR_PEP_ID=MMETSP1396-20130829/4274_1 /ASSEMBLY_ACC=CAM_ASM_000872 /TAXON_ID= /ORGANISM="Pseudokeronopsis sp., Strain Brazil" /LENGTH=53 /DNA_ID=CAMNT_0049679119 /DNA_START=672 /DNA_END=833 /DNA_ORIENTATION=+